MKLETYDSVFNILQNLIKNTKFENHTYTVGGCERDRILGNEIKDIDIVVDLPRGGIELAEYLYENEDLVHAPVIYENFGTVMFRLIDFPDIELEAVHTRKETYRGNSRNPETAFGTIEEDCQRRDFTVNAFYHNISTGKVYDFNGNSRKDLLNKEIRTCGDPDIVFNEDSLRILRAFRFADRLGFRIDGLTFLGMNKHCDRLSIISQERITDEFNKILLGDDPTYMFGGMLGPTLKKYIFPVLDKDGLSNIFNVSLKQNLKRSPKDLIVRLAVLFKSLETTTIKILMRSMKYSNVQIDEVCFLVEKGNKYKDYTFIKPTIRQIMFECKTFSRFCCLTSFLEAIEEKGNELKLTGILDVGDVMFGYKLPVNGDDIMKKYNLKPGPLIKEILEYLQTQCFFNPYQTKEVLLKSVKGILDLKKSME
jgi:poly(A) polymerase